MSNSLNNTSIETALGAPNQISAFVNASGPLDASGTWDDDNGYVRTDKIKKASVLKVLYVPSGGTIVLEGLNNNILVRENVPAGYEWFVLYYRVLASATVSNGQFDPGGTLYTTSIQDFYYGLGK